MKAGIVSITFRKLSVEDIVNLITENGLSAVEWGGDIHVPHGDISKAEYASKLCAKNGVDIVSYGSYYRVGVSEEEGLAFDDVLHTAETLGAPLVRVWAGRKGSGDADDTDWQRVIDDSIRICSMAADAGIRVSYEYHGNTLTDTSASARQLLQRANHEMLRTHWQPPTGLDRERCLYGLNAILPHLSLIHAFTWHKAQDGSNERRPLAEGKKEWLDYLRTASGAPRDVPVLLEFVKDDNPDQFREDAATLLSWLNEL